MDPPQSYLLPPPSPLDLCTRKRPASPDYFSNPKRPTAYVDSSTCQYSPVSNSDSEHSDNSADSKSYVPYSPMTSPRCKSSRPFKAYSKDPLTLSQGVISTDMIFQKDSAEAFMEFRNKIMSRVQCTNKGTNQNMRRVPQNPQKVEDPEYWEKRRKNNEAAKRSRDARRAKEDEIAIRCAFLEQENVQLKFKVATLEAERLRLQNIIYQHHT